MKQQGGHIQYIELVEAVDRKESSGGVRRKSTGYQRSQVSEVLRMADEVYRQRKEETNQGHDCTGYVIMIRAES